MANTIRVPRAHLIMALCLPLAVLLGYFLAEPMDFGNQAIVMLVLGLLALPLLMKWHHPLLLLSWNACISFNFLPGQPGLWLIMAMASLAIAVFNRAVNPEKAFLYVPSLTKALGFFLAVVGVTALLTGVGFGTLGSSRSGGRFYLEIFAASAGYFALTSERIPAHRAGLYVALFFLAGLTALMSNLIYAAGPPFYFLYQVFPVGNALEQAMADYALQPGLFRIGGLMAASMGLYACLLARYGLAGVFDYSKPGRLSLFLLAVAGCLLCGYRGVVVLFLLTCLCLFWLEGLWRTRALPILAVAGLVLAMVVLPQADKLPLTAQRSLSFLPVKVDPQVREQTRASTEWRLEMWKQLLPLVPNYLVKGKGYAVDRNDVYMAQVSSWRGFGVAAESFMVAMEYHSGPLSVLIPFGILGALGFLWFLGAGLHVLYRNYRFGEPALLRINTCLLAVFIAKVVYFFFVFGALHSDLFWFTGVLGLSVSLNGGACKPVEEEDEEEKEVEELELELT